MRANGHLERLARLLVLALGRIQHREVVVRFRQLGIVLGELGEDVDRLRRLVLVGEDQALEEAALCIARLGGEELVDLVERLRVLLLAQQGRGIGELVGVHWSGQGCPEEE